MPKAESDSRTLNRLCDILNCFNQDEPVLTLTEISKRVELSKSTTFRFIEALESQGILNADSAGRGYRLGFQLIHWGTLAQASINLRNDAHPFLQELTDVTGETSILSMRFGNVGTWIEVIESRQPVKLVSRVGQSLQLHAGASSKVLLAFLPDETIENILSEMVLTQYEKNTITDPEKLRKELRAIRERGYATSIEETDKGAMGIAAPVYDHSGKIVAGIGIVAPTARIPEEKIPEYSKPVLEASRRLSRRLGAP